ncbi:MAG: ribonuclease H-like domain-containing protein [Lachnospiraceae bacterium]|nr:ribonuclease H-like domain-containing protein [Lachnospiraceae bacterium]
MKIIQKTFSLEYADAPEGALFLDIETTGLKPETSHLYLFGCIWQDAPGYWQFCQWFAESPFEERAVLREVDDFAKDFRTFVHFNGDRFDLPYLNVKAADFGLDSIFTRRESLDLYPILKPLKTFLRLPNCRQKSFESFLDTGRKDIYNGGELIDFYHRYVRTGSEALLQPLLLHNEEDVLGTVSLLSLFPYVRLINGDAEFSDVSLLSDDEDVLLSLRTKDRYPISVSTLSDGIFLRVDHDRVLLKLPVREQTLKFFYPDPKNYFYLISEDQAVHKSVAAFVNPENRVKATKENCYIKKTARFYPLMQTEGTEVFRECCRGEAYGIWDPALADNVSGWAAYVGAFLRSLKA